MVLRIDHSGRQNSVSKEHQPGVRNVEFSSEADQVDVDRVSALIKSLFAVQNVDPQLQQDGASVRGQFEFGSFADIQRVTRVIQNDGLNVQFSS